ncbi:MAG: zinc metallopeptidase [Clostridia bacterium]|nr:zinc metallopeptidase [Clostridia bacterium]
MAYWEYMLMGVILIPGIIFAIYAQSKITRAYNHYSKVRAKSGVTAIEAARAVLDGANLENVKIRTIGGELADNYDPRNQVVSLSKKIAESDSIAALGIALHEVGHAIQFNKGYKLAKVRTSIVKFTSIISYMLWPIVIIGILLNFVYINGVVGDIFIWAGIAFFGLAVLINLVTLPVEYDASKRAIKILQATGYLDSQEIPGCKAVLNAAALTYVAALLIAILNLLRFILVFARRD